MVWAIEKVEMHKVLILAAAIGHLTKVLVEWKGEKTILREILKITSCPDLIAFSLRSLSEAFRLPAIS